MNRSRATAVFGICALSGTVAIWLNHHAPFLLTDATSCTGALEWAASMTASARPDVPIAAALILWSRVALFAAAALSALAAWRFTQSLIGSATIGIMVAASPLMLPALAPPSVAAIAVAAAVWCAAFGGGVVGVLVGLTTASAIAPGLGLPTAVLCWAIARRRGGPWLALAAAGACLAVTAGVMLATPALPGQTPATETLRCMLPNRANAGALTGAFSTVFSGVGPFALSLGAFGLFAWISERIHADGLSGWTSDRATLAWGWPAAACLTVLFIPSDPLRALAPLMVGFWLLIGRGIAEIVGLGGSGWRRRTAVALMPVLFVAINVQTRLRAPSEIFETPVPMGHDQLTRRDFRALLSELPSGSGLVAEDAVTGVLLQSLSGSLHRAGVALEIVPSSAPAVDVARQTKRVFALPRAQVQLQTRGVRLLDGLTPAVPGVAEVADVRPCVNALGSWQTVTAPQGATTMALVSDEEAARGPMALYVGGAAEIVVSPEAWPHLTERGFYTRRYDLVNPAARQALAGEVATDGAPSQHAAVTAAHVTRTELWRVPKGPRTLVISFSTSPMAALMKQLPQATGTVRLCPTFPFTVRAMAPTSGPLIPR